MKEDPIVKTTNPIPCDPFVVLQTFVDKSKIPPYVAKTWQTFAPEYTRYIFDDEEMRRFMVTYFQPIVLEKFDALSFPHKADLWRYCALYIYGGLYTDIKTELIRPLHEVIQRQDCMYVVKGKGQDHGYYNGFIYTPIKENPLIYELIKYIVETPLEYYHMFCVHLETTLTKKYCVGHLCKIGYNETVEIPDVIVLKEVDMAGHRICKGTTDRYNLCVFITDSHGDILFKTRYHSYPWH